MRTVHRLWGIFIDTQEKHLNKMADRGYRLTKVSKTTYIFEKCTGVQYHYTMERATDHAFKSVEEYTSFLENFGCKVFYQTIKLNCSTVKWGLDEQDAGQISATPRTGTEDLLILEHSDECWQSEEPIEIQRYPSIGNDIFSASPEMILF